MEGDLKRNETVSPMAGKTPSQEMLVDVTRLEREYFERLPDVEDPTQLVSFGTTPNGFLEPFVKKLRCRSSVSAI